MNLLPRHRRSQCRRYGGAKGAVPPPLTTACASHFGSLKLLFLEHHVTARQQTMVEKE